MFGVQELKLNGLAVVPRSFTTAKMVVDGATIFAVIETVADAPAAILAVV